MVFQDDDYFSMNRERNIVCRRIVNLLSACRMYLDQCAHHINNIYGKNSDNANLLKQEKASQYDQYFGYRVMEALRNYTQHRGYPIHSMSFSREWLDFHNEGNSRLLYTVIPLISVSELVDDGGFKQTVLNEMLSIKNKDGIDIRPLIREYIEGIGKIHEKVRESIRPDVEKWESVVNNTIKSYQNELGTDVSLAGLAIVAIRDDDNQWLRVEHRTIFKEFIDRRRGLESKNSVFANLHKRYASNEIRIKDA
jgi:hypothetical protein